MSKNIKAPSKLVPYLKEMLYELQSEKFSAYQVPDSKKCAINGHNVWVAESHNPKWYSRLIKKYPRNRKLQKNWSRVLKYDSTIKRGDIERILLRLCSGKKTFSKYAEDLLCEAEDRLNSKEEPLTNTEIYFWECFKVQFTKDELGKIEKIPKDFWYIIARHKIEHFTLPDWAEDFQGTPF